MRHIISRLPGWWFISLLSFGIIGAIAPHQIGVLLYKTLQVTFGIGLAYLADRALFRFTSPIDKVSHDNFGAARLLARAIIVLAVLTALSIGL